MPGSIRRLLGMAAMAAVVSAGFVATAAAPAPAAAETVGYTVQYQTPNGVAPQRCRLATVDLASGAVTGIGSYGTEPVECAFDLAFSPGGGLYGVSQVTTEVDSPSVDEDPAAPAVPAPTITRVHLVRFDTASGAVTDLGAIGTAEARLDGAGGVTFDPSGNLWVYMIGDDPSCDSDGFCLYKVDPADPADATFFGSDPGETYLFGLTASCSLGVFTMERAETGTGSVDSADEVLVINGGNYLDAVTVGPPSKAQPVGASVGGDRSVHSIDFDSDGTLHALGSVTPKGVFVTGQLSTLDPATGVQTLGPVLSGVEGTTVFGLAVAPPTCPQVVEIQPNFTG